MKRRAREDLTKTFTGLAGWLFADLLLAVAILFLIANTFSQPKPLNLSATATATRAITPTPTPIPTLVPLELKFQRIDFIVQDGQSIDDAVTTKIKQSSVLQGRTVGLVIIYAGAPTQNDIPAAQRVDEKVKRVLLSLNFAGLPNASYYDSTDNNAVTDLTLLGYPASRIIIDIYLFSK